MMVSSVLEFTVATDWMAPTDKFNSIFWLMPLISVLGMLAWISFGFSLARIDVLGSWGGWESAIPFLFYLGLDGLNLIMCRLC